MQIANAQLSAEVRVLKAAGAGNPAQTGSAAPPTISTAMASVTAVTLRAYHNHGKRFAALSELWVKRAVNPFISKGSTATLHPLTHRNASPTLHTPLHCSLYLLSMGHLHLCCLSVHLRIHPINPNPINRSPESHHDWPGFETTLPGTLSVFRPMAPPTMGEQCGVGSSRSIP